MCLHFEINTLIVAIDMLLNMMENAMLRSITFSVRRSQHSKVVQLPVKMISWSCLLDGKLRRTRKAWFIRSSLITPLIHIVLCSLMVIPTPQTIRTIPENRVEVDNLTNGVIHTESVIVIAKY